MRPGECWRNTLTGAVVRVVEADPRGDVVYDIRARFGPARRCTVEAYGWAKSMLTGHYERVGQEEYERARPRPSASTTNREHNDRSTKMNKTELSQVQKKAIDAYCKTGSVVQVADILKFSPTRARVVMQAARERMMESFIRADAARLASFKKHSGYGEELFFTARVAAPKAAKRPAPRAKKAVKHTESKKSTRPARVAKPNGGGVIHTVAQG